MNQIFFILLITLTNNFIACLSASQNRLFPLGQTSKGLCVVETRLYRTELREKDKEVIELKPAWGGITYFKIYDKDYKVIYSEPIDTIGLFAQKHYESIIANTFKKGMKLAEKYPDFIAAKPISIKFCDYQQTCSNARFLFDTKNNRIAIRLSGKIKYDVPVLFDSASIASNLLNYLGGFDDAELSAKLFKENLYINSVREFQIGNKKLTVVHIGIGQTNSSSKEYRADFAFNDISKSVFQEPVLHHGHGFDFYIWD